MEHYHKCEFNIHFVFIIFFFYFFLTQLHNISLFRNKKKIFGSHNVYCVRGKFQSDSLIILSKIFFYYLKKKIHRLPPGSEFSLVSLKVSAKIHEWHSIFRQFSLWNTSSLTPGTDILSKFIIFARINMIFNDIFYNNETMNNIILFFINLEHLRHAKVNSSLDKLHK